MTLRLPRRDVDSPLGGDQPFPQGIFTFTLQEPSENATRTRPTPDFMHDGSQLMHDDGEILSVWLGNAVQQEPGGEDPGDRIYFLDIVTRDGAIEIEEVDLENGAQLVGWRMQQSAQLYVKLADALGATTEDEDGYVVPAPNFRQLLTEGVFDGQRLIAEIRHRKGKGASAGRKFPFVRNIFAVNPGG